MTASALEGIGLSKAYGGVTVLDGVDVSVRSGEVHAILGENGAGKSTLMKMLTGIVRPDAGILRREGTALDLPSPRAAASAGIAIVHQELHLVPQLSVTDNLMLVRPPAAREIRRGSARERAFVCALLSRVGLACDPDMVAEDLSVADSQLLEIAKALALDAHVLVFDEPTAALLPAEIERLLGLIGDLRAQGHAIFYISHALDEVMRIADRITVLRDGRTAAEYARDAFDRDRIVHAMIDRPVALYQQGLPPIGDDVVLHAEAAASAYVSHVEFSLRAGEIVGFAGLVGSGMQEAGRLIAGADPLVAGSLALHGRPIRMASPREAVRAGIALVPEERKRDGIVAERSVTENLHLGRYRLISRHGLASPVVAARHARAAVERFQVRLASLGQPIATLSGGNQQKILFARAAAGAPHVLVIAAPTRGVDIGAKDAIHAQILELARCGTAIVLISSELEEVLGLSHRVAVFAGGRMVRVLDRSEATPEAIMGLAVASRHEDHCRAA